MLHLTTGKDMQDVTTLNSRVSSLTKTISLVKVNQKINLSNL